MVFTSIHASCTYKIEKVSVCETSHRSEIGDENKNPTIVGFCTLLMGSPGKKYIGFRNSNCDGDGNDDDNSDGDRDAKGNGDGVGNGIGNC